MKYIIVLLALVFLINVTRCSVTERMSIDENGGGKFLYASDGFKMMSMMESTFKK